MQIIGKTPLGVCGGLATDKVGTDVLRMQRIYPTIVVWVRLVW
jgi:hypothetical protein